MNAQTAQMDDLQLIALPTAVSCTEMFVRFALSEWNLRAMLEPAVYVGRELVGSMVATAALHTPGLITVRLRLRGDSLVVEVEDMLVAFPPTVPVTLSGYHAGVVSLAGRGNLLWCELALPTGLDAASVRLPRREQRRSPAAEQLGEERSEVDPQVIQRIFTALSQPPQGGSEWHR
ncbi:hypothetical protein GCM10010174_77390 [Kutzneria viridogrisea]|uniref:Uncharacterized protein n=2 Tax=Kutzneria TaxID=43356 RepID=W5WDJ0_9PSEU|nr:hypothetical protein [Kutzneria albida]AHH96259.1 hypothetical protein KALB_2891 [Kutzneria albida DSM 43870]MBA8928528.1 hypothetical protein [Kutzneria viridogrisea]